MVKVKVTHHIGDVVNPAPGRRRHERQVGRPPGRAGGQVGRSCQQQVHRHHELKHTHTLSLSLQLLADI